MEIQAREFEGTWEELALYEPEFRGRKLRLTVLPEIEKSALPMQDAARNEMKPGMKP